LGWDFQYWLLGEISNIGFWVRFPILAFGWDFKFWLLGETFKYWLLALKW
jgi:hypothetical protein